jgi:AcrR family transcriptional regulator
VRERLQQAALELCHDRGYDRTTTSEIAARAGVTERTFFRYFPDKREVLFDGEAKLRLALTTAIAKASDELGPLETLIAAFRSIEKMLEDNRPFAEPRHHVIVNTPALHERELAKIASLTEALASALRYRGVNNRLAMLAARTGMTAFGHAALSWFEDPALGFGGHLDQAFRELQSLIVGKSPN